LAIDNGDVDQSNGHLRSKLCGSRSLCHRGTRGRDYSNEDCGVSSHGPR